MKLIFLYIYIYLSILKNKFDKIPKAVSYKEKLICLTKSLIKFGYKPKYFVS